MLIKEGMKVIVKVPADEHGAERLLKFNGLETIITRIKRIKITDGLGRSNSYPIFELKWCETPQGRAYSFVREWLEIPREGAENESVKSE